MIHSSLLGHRRHHSLSLSGLCRRGQSIVFVDTCVSCFDTVLMLGAGLKNGHAPACNRAVFFVYVVVVVVVIMAETITGTL